MKHIACILLLSVIGTFIYSQDLSKLSKDQIDEIKTKDKLRTIDNFIDSLDSRDPLEAAVAAFHLGERSSESKEALNKLISLLTDDRSVDVRGLFSMRTVLQFEYENTTPGQESAIAIARIDPSSFRILEAAYRQNRFASYYSKRNIVCGLLELGNELSIKCLRNYMNYENESPFIRSFIINKLYRHTDIYEDLVRFLEHPSSLIKGSAIQAMGYSGHPECLEYLVEIYREELEKPAREQKYVRELIESISNITNRSFYPEEELFDWWEENKDSIRTIR